MPPAAHDNIVMDIDKDDVDSDFDDDMDSVVYQTRRLILWRNLSGKTKSFWQERANTLNV